MEQTVQTIRVYNILRNKNFSEEEAEIVAAAIIGTNPKAMDLISRLVGITK